MRRFKPLRPAASVLPLTLALCIMGNSVQFSRIAFDDVSERALFLLSAEKPADISSISIATSSRYFVALIVWDSDKESPADIAHVACILLKEGCVYFCCWGSGCERLHDIIDEEYAKTGVSMLDDGSTLMTTWHSDESLDEAIWFSLTTAFPDDRFFDECSAVVSICVGNEARAREIAISLADPRALVERVVGKDEGESQNP